MTRIYRNLNTLSLKLIITLMYTQCLASPVSKIARDPKLKQGLLTPTTTLQHLTSFGVICHPG